MSRSDSLDDYMTREHVSPPTVGLSPSVRTILNGTVVSATCDWAGAFVLWGAALSAMAERARPAARTTAAKGNGALGRSKDVLNRAPCATDRGGYCSKSCRALHVALRRWRIKPLWPAPAYT